MNFFTVSHSLQVEDKHKNIHLGGHIVLHVVHSDPWSCSADMGPSQDASVLLRTDVVRVQRLTGEGHKGASEGFSA